MCCGERPTVRRTVAWINPKQSKKSFFTQFSQATKRPKFNAQIWRFDQKITKILAMFIGSPTVKKRIVVWCRNLKQPWISLIFTVNSITPFLVRGSKDSFVITSDSLIFNGFRMFQSWTTNRKETHCCVKNFTAYFMCLYFVFHISTVNADL